MSNIATNWSVYLLLCQGQKIYTGISNDPVKRCSAHIQGKGAKFTRMYPPEAMKIVGCHFSKNEALSLEHKIKQLNAHEKQRIWDNIR